MMLILNTLFFVVGLVTGVFVYSQMLLPIIYGVPVATYMVLKGKLKPMGILMQFVTPIIWVVGLIIIGTVLAYIWPSLGSFFSNNDAFNAGTFFGLSILIYNLFTKSGRATIRQDFSSTTVARYGQ